MKQEMRWQWHQLHYAQITHTSFQTDNHASTSLFIPLQVGHNTVVTKPTCQIVYVYVYREGAGLYQPHRHRPPTGPYAVPKQLSVVAEFYILKCCRVSQR